MRLKLPAFMRLYWLLLGLVFLCGVWGLAQNLATNTPPRVEPEAAAAGPPAGSAGLDVLSFGLNRVQALDTIKLLGEPLWKYLASLIYLVLAFLSAKALDWLISGRLRKWAAKTETDLDDLFLQVIHGPIKVIAFVILLHVGLRVFAWPAWVEDYLSKALQIVVAWSLTYMALKGVDLFIAYWRKRVSTDEDRAFDDQLFPIIRKSVKVFVVVVAVLLTSQNLGLNITSVLASLSIGGLALGLAAQDTIANLFGAVAIFMDKPFRMGDRIKVDTVDGVVETIGLRSTRVRNADGHLITIPNKTMGGATITNVTRRPGIRTEMNIGLTYDTPPEKVRRALGILDDVFKTHPMTQEVIVSFNKFEASALNLYVIHWWKGGDPKAHLAGLQSMNLAIMQRFAAERIEFAFPTQTLFLKQDSDWKLTGGNVPPGRY